MANANLNAAKKGEFYAQYADIAREIDIADLKWDYLDGDGDFLSDEVKALRDEADIIVTNPPFSLFREFLAWILAAKSAKCAKIGGWACRPLRPLRSLRLKTGTGMGDENGRKERKVRKDRR